MYRGFKKLALCILSTALAGSMALAIQSEYKNTLLKVELQKTSDNSYGINLYTQNNFVEPVKIIKKSDLNYYILLPETKNQTTSVITNSKDIRNVTVESFKYEGADVDNGYVKVNINTSKPLYFNISTKLNTSANTSQKQAIANLQPKIDIQQEQNSREYKIQKKNFISSTKKITQNIKKETPVQKKAIPVLHEAIANNQFIQSEEIDTILEQDNFLDDDKELQNYEKLESIDVVREESLLEKGYLEDNLEEISKLANIKTGFFAKYKKDLQEKLSHYNLEFKDLFLMFFVGILSFLLVFMTLLRKQKNVRLKNKKELLTKTGSPFVPKEEDETIKNDGQYFVFDNGVKQTSLIGPATCEEPKKYELSSYEPDLKDNYIPGSFRDYADKNEFDIIQKVLKEQAPKDYDLSDTTQELPKIVEEPIGENLNDLVFSQKKEHSKPQFKNNTASTISKQEEFSEPIVLSKVEIAPERGFMCISYNDNINLMGYIFDDVFPLYNFKQTKLENYDIKYRLSDRTQDGANFIVKIDKTKVLISVKNSSMALEVVL